LEDCSWEIFTPVEGSAQTDMCGVCATEQPTRYTSTSGAGTLWGGVAIYTLPSRALLKTVTRTGRAWPVTTWTLPCGKRSLGRWCVSQLRLVGWPKSRPALSTAVCGAVGMLGPITLLYPNRKRSQERPCTFFFMPHTTRCGVGTQGAFHEEPCLK
jgi:hypothetical protein